MEVMVPLVIIAMSLDSRNPSAAIAAGRAYTRQSGIEQMFQDYEERTYSEELRANVGTMMWITKTITEQKLTFEVRF